MADGGGLESVEPISTIPVEISPDDGFAFLLSLWTYNSTKARCFSIVTIKGPVVTATHFPVDEEHNWKKALQDIQTFIAKNLEKWNKEGYNVYFQVLPLSRKPVEGRGTAADVEVGQWLWCDLDYKEVVEDGGECGECREFPDHALECCYRAGGRLVRVRRPPLSQVLDEVERKLGFGPTFVVDSGCGYHLYFKLKREIDAKELSRLESMLVEVLGGDPQSKDLARILRLPGSINPRVGRVVKVIYSDPLNELEPEEVKERLQALTQKPAAWEGGDGLREPTKDGVERIVGRLKEQYKPGYRHNMLLYLSGWLAKARISPLAAVKIVKMLHAVTQDEDPLKERLATVVYSYKKAGIDVDRYAKEIEALTGVRPYGLGSEVRECEVKGISGLFEVLEKVAGKEEALSIIRELEEIIGHPNPYWDVVLVPLNLERQIYLAADFREKAVWRARKVKDRVVLIDRVLDACPSRVAYYRSPLGGTARYEVELADPASPEPLVFGPMIFDELVAELKSEGIVLAPKLIDGALAVLLRYFIRTGRAEIRRGIESPGFYLVDGKVTAVKWEAGQLDVEKLREALAFLNELAEKWFKHVEAKFSFVMKWGAAAPFTFILKSSRKVLQKYIFLYGDAATGKSTLGRIVLKLWGLDIEHEQGGTFVDTVARLGRALSLSTFPVLIDEPGGMLQNVDVVEMLKIACVDTLARGKYVKGTYVKYPALAPLIFTSNRFLPNDEALLRRFFVLTFSYGEKIPAERQEEFAESVEPRLPILREVGACIARMVMENPDLLNDRNMLRLGEKLLAKCYEVAGMERPAWLSLTYESEAQPQISALERFLVKLVMLIHNLYAQYYAKERGVPEPETVNIVTKFRILLEARQIPGMMLKDSNTVVMLTMLLEELEMTKEISLKSLSELLGGEARGYKYKSVRVEGRVLMGIEAPKQVLEELLTTVPQ